MSWEVYKTDEEHYIIKNDDYRFDLTEKPHIEKLLKLLDENEQLKSENQLLKSRNQKLKLNNELYDTENEKLRIQLKNTSDQRNEFHCAVMENANRVCELEKENEQLKKDAKY